MSKSSVVTVAGPFKSRKDADETASYLGSENHSVFSVEQKDNEGYGLDIFDYYVERDNSIVPKLIFGKTFSEIQDMQQKRKANPAPRKRAAKKSTPKSFDQFTKRQLQDFITGCHNARDYGPEFTAACYALNSQTTAPRKTNPAKRPAPKKRALSRPSQVTKKAPTKRLLARRKVAAKKPVKGYFPNPRKKRDSYAEFAPVEIQINTGAGWILYAGASDTESAKKIATDLSLLPKFKNVAIRVMG